MADSSGTSDKLDSKVLVEILEWNGKSSFYGPIDTITEAHAWAYRFVSSDLSTTGYKTHWMNLIVEDKDDWMVV